MTPERLKEIERQHETAAKYCTDYDTIPGCVERAVRLIPDLIAELRRLQPEGQPSCVCAAYPCPHDKAKAEPQPQSAGPRCPKCQSATSSIYYLLRYHQGFCNFPGCGYKGDWREFFKSESGEELMVAYVELSHLRVTGVA